MSGSLSKKELVSMYLASVDYIKKKQEDGTLYDPSPIMEKKDDDVIQTSRNVFVKIDDSVSQTPCLECKTMCSGYWCISRHGAKRPYPFCKACLKNGLGLTWTSHTISVDYNNGYPPLL